MASKETHDGYWVDIDNVMTEIKRVMEEHNLSRLPSKGTLVKLGESSLSSSITKYHGGFRKIRELMGDVSEHGKWKDIDFAVEEAQRIMDAEGLDRLPGPDELTRRGYRGFCHAVFRYHKGFPQFRQVLKDRLGQDSNIDLGRMQPIVKSGSWKDLDYTLEQVEKAMEEEGWQTLPNADALVKSGYSGISNAIQTHHGGFRNFRGVLGQKNLPREAGLWKNLDYTIEQATEIMKSEGWDDLPGDHILRKSRYSSLSRAIYLYHGGILEFRQALDAHLGRASNENQLEELLTTYAGGNSHE